MRTPYACLLQLAPSLGAQVSLAAVVGHTDGPLAGLAQLDALGEPALQPWWAVRAHLLAELGRRDDSGRAYAKAISLTTDPIARRYLANAMRCADFRRGACLTIP